MLKQKSLGENGCILTLSLAAILHPEMYETLEHWCRISAIKTLRDLKVSNLGLFGLSDDSTGTRLHLFWDSFFCKHLCRLSLVSNGGDVIGGWLATNQWKKNKVANVPSNPKQRSSQSGLNEFTKAPTYGNTFS